MKKKFLSVLVAGVILGTPASAFAHVTVKPQQVVAAEYQLFTTSVPNEREVAVTGIRLVIPKNVESVTPTVKPGWNIETKKSSDTITEIIWTGGAIDAGLRDDFTFSAQAPAKATTITWKAYQTYSDGVIAAWDQSPAAKSGHDDESKGPYSTTKVVNESNEEAVATKSDAAGVFVLAGSALVVSLIALVRPSRVKAS